MVYAENSSEIPPDLRNASISKYSVGVMFWGGICTKWLIPLDGPINFTRWLRNQRSDNNSKRLYMTGELYAKFLDEEAIPAIAEVVEDLDEFIFQDDQDLKHRTKVAMNVVADHFEERIEPDDGDAKFADVWPIKNVWGILNEKTRAQAFDSLNSLVDFISLEWQNIRPEQCEAMIDKIPKRLAQMIQLDGNQVYKD